MILTLAQGKETKHFDMIDNKQIEQQSMLVLRNN